MFIFSSHYRKKDVGADLRSCKDLLNKQKVLESEMFSLETRISEAYENGHQMAQCGHFDSDNILKSCISLKDRFERVKVRSRNGECFNY